MAEEENKAEEEQEEQESGGKSNKKLIIIIVVVAFLAIGLSVGATLFLLGGDGDEAEEAVESEVVVEQVKLPASYFDIKPAFLVTFNVGGRQRYMQISLSVSSRDASVFDALEHHMPLIRSKLISTYGSQKFEEIETNDGKLMLQAKTIEVINNVLDGEGEPPIENVFFTNFVLQ